MHEELWTEVRDIVQEAVIKTIPKKKKWKKAKWLSEEAIQIAEKRKVKGKGEKERYTHLNSEFQRIARRDEKAFLSDQCKEIEGKNKNKVHIFQSYIYQGNISCKKGQKWYGPNRIRNIKKRWQEYTEELFKKDLHNPGNHDGMITHLEPDILECEVKWALGSITTNKASGGNGIPVELFQILKDDALKVLHPICQQIWKTQ